MVGKLRESCISTKGETREHIALVSMGNSLPVLMSRTGYQNTY